MKKLSILFTCLICLAACKKDNATPDKPCTGSIQFQNTSENTYQVSLNGKVLRNIKGHEIYNLDALEVRYDTVKVLQLEGYLLYPTEKNYTLNVDCNQLGVVKFP